MKKFTKLLLATLLVVVTATLTACAPFNAELAKTILESKGYEVEISSDNVGVDGVEIVSARKGEDAIMVYYCDTAELADLAFEEVQDILDEAVVEGLKIGKKEKMVYIGTKQAINDFYIIKL